MIPLNKQLESLLFKLNSYVCVARAALLTINTSETADQRDVLVFGSITSLQEHSGFNCGSLSFDRGIFSIFPARTCRHAKPSGLWGLKLKLKLSREKNKKCLVKMRFT